jgi:hypothetical protein
LIAPPTSSLAEAKAWLKQEMAGWKQAVDEVGIVVDE